MENSISKSFKMGSLIRFTIPSIVMMIFISLYSIVDGVFVARFVNTDALSAINIVYPFISFVVAVSIMLATGSSAIIAKKFGEGKEHEGREAFTLTIIVGVILSLIISLIGFVFSKEIINLMGANNVVYGYCLQYFKVVLMFIPMYILNMLFQYLTITAGKPNMGLILTLIGGFTNIILDYVFVAKIGMGISGAAYATGIGNLLPVIIGLVYFLKRKCSLYFVKTKFNYRELLDICVNGCSEMIINVSIGLTTMLFNIVTMNLLGPDGVAAITIILYGQFLITSTYIGFSTGVAPIISYNYGNENKIELKKIMKYSIKIIIASSIVLFLFSIIFSKGIVGIFSSRGSSVYEIAYVGFMIFSISFLVGGINIFASAMFTAFSNGKVSGIISFIRTFVFTVIGIIFLPKIMGINGVWLAVPIAEVLSMIISIHYINKYKNIYGYGKDHIIEVES